MYRFLALALALLFSGLWPTAALARVAPPETPSEPVKEVLHGVEIVDPYRWLEGSDAPELKSEDPGLDRRVETWTEEQNSYTRGVLDALPGREVFGSRLGELLETGSVSAPIQRGDLLFYLERQGRQAQQVLWVRRGEGEPRVLVDPNTLDAEGLTTLGWFTPSPDGRRVAFSLFRSGDENTTLYLLETEGARWLAEEIPGKVTNINWLPDGESFVYRRLSDIENPYSGIVQYHVVGRHHRFDPVLFEQYTEGPLATTWGPHSALDSSGRWLVISYFTGTESNDLWVYDFRHWLATGELDRVDLIVGERAQSFGFIKNDTFFVQTTLDAPNGRVIGIDLENPGREHWKEIVPEQAEAVVQGTAPSAWSFAVTYLEQASTRIELFDYRGRSQGDLELPGLGTASLTSQAASREVFLTFESFNEPQSIYRVDLETGKRDLWARPDMPVDPSRLVVEQKTYTSKDGTPVTLFLIHAKELEKSGKNPTLLTGYGGFNIPRTPRFNPQVIPWLEAGGVYAVANLRGGGEYGESWHRAGMLANKQNVFDDFIAAGEYLIEAGYTNPGQLGVAGGSNGGLLTGAVLVQRPDLFSAVASLVPLLDMLRYQYFLMARYWVPEYGTSENPEHLPFLEAYSPYHNVEKGVEYPAVLLTAGENDTRVHPLHARKMAARLQAATSNDVEKEPVLLWVEGDVGHGRGKPLELRKRDATDLLSFMGWQLGLRVE